MVEIDLLLCGEEDFVRHLKWVAGARGKAIDADDIVRTFLDEALLQIRIALQIAGGDLAIQAFLNRPRALSGSRKASRKR